MSDNLIIIQGDDLDTDININTHEVSDIIEEVYFTCAKLGMQQLLPYDSLREVYRLQIPHTQTIDFPTVNTTYDITVRLRGNIITTVIFNGRLTVYGKVNEVVM